MNSSYDTFEIKAENHLAYPWNGVLDFGSCFPAGAVKEGDAFHLEDRQRSKIPLQWRPLVSDADGTCRWAHFFFPVQLGKSEFKHWTVKPGAVPAQRGLEVTQNVAKICVINGERKIVFNSDSPLGLAEVWAQKVLLLDGSTSNAQMRFENQELFEMAEPWELSVARANDFEIVVEAAGKLAPATGKEGDGIFLHLRYTIRLGQPAIDVNVYFSNRRQDDQELSLQEFAVTFGLANPVRTTQVQQTNYGNLCLSRDYCIGGDIEIENGVVTTPNAIDIPSPQELRPFFRKFDAQQYFGRVEPFAAATQEQSGVLFAWQRSTFLDGNSFATNGKKATLTLVSKATPARIIPQGFSRSFDFSIVPFSGKLSSEQVFEAASVAECRPLLSVHPQWYIQNQAEEMERFLPFLPKQHPRYEKRLWRGFAIRYHRGFYDNGDYPSARGSTPTEPVLPPYTWNNNEEDHLKGIAAMLMRTGDPSYMEDMRRCARHLVEVDRFAYSSDPLQNGILIAHARNHYDGSGYPSHCWAEGLLLYYKLTGDNDALDAFFDLCECLLRWFKVPEEILYSDAREMGVSITNLAHAYTLTGDKRYLDGAQVFIDHFKKQMQEDGGLYYKKGAAWTKYSEYVAVEGLWDYYELIGGEDIKVLLLDIIQWITEYLLDMTGSYDARSTSESFLQVFYIAYHLTGDESWLEKGRPVLEQSVSQTAIHPMLMFNNNAAFYHEAAKRGWFNDGWAPLEPSHVHRAVGRQHNEPEFGWDKLGPRQ